MERNYENLTWDEKREEFLKDIDRNVNSIRDEVNEALEELKRKIASGEIDKISEKAKSNSIKPGVKVPNKTKRKLITKREIAVVIIAGIIITGICMAAPKVKATINDFKNNKVVNEEIGKFNFEVMEDSINIHVNENGHWHEKFNIIEEAKNRYDDPIIGVYIIYYSLDKWCHNNDFGSYFIYINNAYDTNYSDLNDFLSQNGFENKNEWRKYVIEKLKVEKELNGNSNLGRQ